MDYTAVYPDYRGFLRMAKNANNPDYEPGGLLKLAGYKQLPWIQRPSKKENEGIKEAIKRLKLDMSIDIIDEEGNRAYANFIRK